MPFTLSYVPDGYEPTEVGSGVWAGVLGVTRVVGETGEVAGATFATSVPTSGLIKPLTAPDAFNGKKSTGPDFPNGFQLFISDGKKAKGGLADGHQPPTEPRCGNGFCDFWSADGSLMAQVASEGQLSNAEMSGCRGEPAQRAFAGDGLVHPDGATRPPRLPPENRERG
jgi:hypothetical protein